MRSTEGLMFILRKNGRQCFKSLLPPSPYGPSAPRAGQQKSKTVALWLLNADWGASRRSGKPKPTRVMNRAISADDPRRTSRRFL
jgi:hypothetical protein